MSTPAQAERFRIDELAQRSGLPSGTIRFYQREVARTATLEERRRIARDLHDGLAQELAYIVSQTRALRHSALGAAAIG